jgi:hypothetical protein
MGNLAIRRAIIAVHPAMGMIYSQNNAVLWIIRRLMQSLYNAVVFVLFFLFSAPFPEEFRLNSSFCHFWVAGIEYP